MHYKQEAPTLAQTAKKERLFSLAEKNAFKILKDQKREVKYVFTANNRFQYFQKPLFSIFIPPSSINNDKKEGREEKKKPFSYESTFTRIRTRRGRRARKYNVTTLIDIKILQRTTLSLISLPLTLSSSSLHYSLLLNRSFASKKRLELLYVQILVAHANKNFPLQFLFTQ